MLFISMKNFNEELRAKIEAAKMIQLSPSDTQIDKSLREQKILEAIAATKTIGLNQSATVVDTCIREQKILKELDSELKLFRHDLDESDILRTLKILDILDTYPDVFKYRNALKLFYILARIEYILDTTLREYCDLSKVEFNTTTKAMIRNGLIVKNEYDELELTLEGKSLATRIGHSFF